MKWEYRIDESPNQGELNRRGADGWELVNTMNWSKTNAMGLQSDSFWCFFKRPLGTCTLAKGSACGHSMQGSCAECAP